MIPAQLVTTSNAFAQLLDQVRTEPLLAVDTEAASFHRYRDRVYLLQLSTRSTTWIVDPLEVEGLPGLDRILGDGGIEIVFHDADYDLRLLGHEFGYRANHLFDTRVAAQFLNEPGIGLAALLEKYFQVRLDKRYQRADWSSRPLEPEMLAYAATDTRYLPELRDVLRQQLVERGRLHWAEEEFELLGNVRWPVAEEPAVAALGTKGARTMKPRELAVFRELYVWRENLAETLDRAPFRVAGNEVLFVLSRQVPKDVEALKKIRGLGREIQQNRSTEILTAIRRGLELPEAELPRYPRPPRHRPDPGAEQRLERLKVIRSAESERLELPTGLLAPNWLLESIARSRPATLPDLALVPGIRKWQVEAVGKQLIV